MTPEMRARITARNETAAGFAEVKRDAMATANAIEASSARAAAGLAVQNRALAATGSLSRMAAAQQRNLVFQLNDIGVSLASGMNPLMVAAQQGSQISTIYGPSEGGLGRALQETGKLAAGMVGKFWPIGAAVGAATGAVAAMTAEINKASEVQVSFGDTAMATWQVFSESVYTLVEPAISSIVGWLGGLWDTVRPAIVDVGNGITATFVGAFNALTAYWSKFPQVIGDIVYSAANATIDGVEAMLNGSIGLINEFTQGARGALSAIGLEVGDIGSVSLGNIDNPFAGTLGNVAGEMSESFTDAFSTDFLGQAFEAIKTRAIELASATDVASDSLKAANDNAKALGNTLNKDLAEAADKSSMSMLGAFGQLTGALGQLFNDNKAFSVASAVINTAEGITKALAQGGALGFVSAAAVAASGAAQVATILSAQPGSASAPSVGASPAASSATGGATGVGAPGVNVVLQGGGRYSRDEVKAILESMNEYFGDTGKINSVVAALMLYLPSALIVTPTNGVNFSRPVIGWQQLVTAAGIAATSEDADYPAVRLANPNTNELWVSDSTSTQYLTVTLDGSVDTDYLAVARHNFGTIGASLTVEGDTGSGYAAVSDQVGPADDKPLMFRFEAAAYTGLRLKIESVSAEPQAAVLFVGALLVMEKGVQPGHTPLPYGRVRDVITGRSQSGEFLGRIESGGKLRSTAMFKVLTPSFVRGDLAAFLAYSGPFFFAWSPQTYSAEVGYAWCVNDPVPVPSTHAGFTDLTLEMEGLAL